MAQPAMATHVAMAALKAPVAMATYVSCSTQTSASLMAGYTWATAQLVSETHAMNQTLKVLVALAVRASSRY
jgi:hypothetical protein